MIEIVRGEDVDMPEVVVSESMPEVVRGVETYQANAKTVKVSQPKGAKAPVVEMLHERAGTEKVIPFDDAKVASVPAPVSVSSSNEISTNVPSAKVLNVAETLAENATAAAADAPEVVATEQPVPVTASSSPNNLIPSGGEVIAATGPAAAAVKETPDAKEEYSSRVATSQAAVSPPPPASSITSPSTGQGEVKTANGQGFFEKMRRSLISDAYAEEVPPPAPPALPAIDLPEMGVVEELPPAPEGLKDLALPPAGGMEDLELQTTSGPLPEPATIQASAPLPTPQVVLPQENMESPAVQVGSTQMIDHQAPVPDTPKALAESAAQKVLADAQMEALRKQAQTPAAAALPTPTFKAAVTNTAVAPKPVKKAKQLTDIAAPSEGIQHAMPLPVVDVPVKVEPTMQLASNGAPVNNITEPKDQLSPETQTILDNLPDRLQKKSKTKKYKPVSLKREKESAPLDVAEESSELGITVSTRTKPDVDMSYELEKAYNALVAGHTEIAITGYQNVLDAEPYNQDALFGLATAFHRIGRAERARPLYGKLLAINPNHREALNNFLLLMSEEAPNEALLRLKELQSANPYFSPIAAQMALVYEKLGDMSGAVMAMKEAIALESDNLLYRYNLAILYDKMGAWDEAKHLYRYIVEAYERGQDLPGDIVNIKRRLEYITLKANTQKAAMVRP